MGLSPNPCALAISGLDPSAGAGIFADLRAFAAARVWGCGVVAVLTVQTTAGLRSARPVDTALLLRQLRELLRHHDVRAIKIGGLGSASNARAVARWLAGAARQLPVVFDPVVHATLGSKRASLGPTSKHVILAVAERCTVFTPNIPEAEALLRARIVSIQDAERAARELVRLGSRAALVKGGHLPGRSAGEPITDVLAIGRNVIHFKTHRLRSAVHGTGCTLASLIAGRLAHASSIDDATIVAAIRWAKHKLARALAQPRIIGGGLAVLDP